ncbi:hypothetical protein N9N71_02195 [Synechococcus sp. AH-229-G18]|nr:hypothetical protein [Synechococcus sp. AH-229-G18]
MAVKQVLYKNRQYNVSNLNEETKQLMSLIKASNEQIARAQAEIAIAEAGRAVINSKLEEQLKDVPSEEAPTNEENN